MVRLRESPSPSCAQFDFKFRETAFGRIMERIYKRLEFSFREMQLKAPAYFHFARASRRHPEEENTRHRR